MTMVRMDDMMVVKWRLAASLRFVFIFSIAARILWQIHVILRACIIYGSLSDVKFHIFLFFSFILVVVVEYAGATIRYGERR